MRAVVFGQSGQVATELQRQAGAAGANLIVLGREAADLSAPQNAASVLRGLIKSVDVVINAAAYTAVDRAESEPEIAQAVNGDAPGALAKIAADAGKPFLHISTDYVFDGTGNAAWKPQDSVGPLGVYGQTKLAGEEGVRAAGGPHAILRTSWVFSAHGANFVRTMLRLGADRDALSIVDDQIGGPTPAGRIAEALFTVARQMTNGAAPSGTYHFAGTPATSWAGFAEEIFRQSAMSVAVNKIPASEFPTPAARPANSRLDCSSLQADYGITAPDWRQDLTQVLRDLGVAQAG